MTEIILDLEQDLSYAALKERFESIAREYSLAVIEGVEAGKEYPEASSNVRFLGDFIFAISCVVEDNESAGHDK
jgi:hypothetical protein